MQKDLQSFRNCTKVQSTLGGCRNSASGGRQSDSVINIERIPNCLLWWCFRAAWCMLVGIRCDTKYWTFQDAKMKAIQGSNYVWVSIFKPSCSKQNAHIYAIYDYSLDILLEYEVVTFCSKSFSWKEGNQCWRAESTELCSCGLKIGILGQQSFKISFKILKPNSFPFGSWKGNRTSRRNVDQSKLCKWCRNT